MRLQLSIHRHELPPVELLWAFPDEKTRSTTVSQLLEDINNIVPLESEEWGLEDYVVQFGKFECLHFSRVQELLKEDDNLIVRPLNTNDLRARTLSGRHQITPDGKRLYDGIPFGRPYLRRPARPEIHIPGRRAILPAANNDSDTVAGLQNNSTESALVDSRQDTGLVGLGEEDDRDGQLQLTDGSTYGPRVHFSDNNHNQEQGLMRLASDDEESEDYMPSGTSSDADETEDSDESSSDSDASSDSSDDESSSMDDSEDEASQTANGKDNAQVVDDSAYASQSMESKRSEGTQRQKPPGTGSRTTRGRNFRRRMHMKLEHYKRSGYLSKDAKFAELEQLLQSISQDPDREVSTTHTGNAFNDDTPREINTSLSEQPSFTSKASASRKQHTSTHAPTHKSASESKPSYTRALTHKSAPRSESSPVPSSTHSSAPESISPRAHSSTRTSPDISDQEDYEDSNMATNRNKKLQNRAQSHDAPPSSSYNNENNSGGPSTRTARLDIAASQRMIFHQLGMKPTGPLTSNHQGGPPNAQTPPMPAPSTSAGARMPSRPPKIFASSAPPHTFPGAAVSPDDPDYWRTKIVLRARECVQDGVLPRLPPFPYQPPARAAKRGRRASARDANPRPAKVARGEPPAPTSPQPSPRKDGWEKLVFEPSVSFTNAAGEPDLPGPPNLPPLSPADALPNTAITFRRVELVGRAPGVGPWRAGCIMRRTGGEAGAGEGLELALSMLYGTKKAGEGEAEEEAGWEERTEEGWVRVGWGELVDVRKMGEATASFEA
ncbi:MAG: hypothetical protein M1821_004731 [Bathelium mastoideum]|nr:MAG: hypothetical protein M1821_004731 [Bathelium mastoideum]